MTNETASSEGIGDEQLLVTFSLGDEEFGFNIMSVQEIIRLPKMSRVPMAPDYLDGVANLRGMILPIIDTRSRFGMPRAEETDRTRVLVIDVNGIRTGLRVDRVRQVTRINKGDEDLPPPVVRGISSDFLKGVVKLDNGKRMILDLDPKPICLLDIQSQQQAQSTLQENAGETAAGNSKMDETTQIVSFRLGEEEYAFPMEKVREILRYEKPNAVPDVPSYVLGMLTVRGNILPVLDLRVLLGFKAHSDELVGRSLSIKAALEDNRNSVASSVKSNTTEKLPTAALDQIIKWTSTFSTSSQVIIEQLAKIKASVEQIPKDLHSLSGLPRGEDSAAHRKFQSETSASYSVALQLIEAFGHTVAESIREDQRLVVVDAAGQLVALVVDKVREVLNVGKSQIDQPPKMGNSGFVMGIAKLNEGKRLIMILDSNHLTKDESMKQLSNRDGGGANANNDAHRHSSNGSIADEKQFVTFRLADGEYGIPISQIQEIDRYSKMTKIPSAPEYMEGICNLRGEIIPVINARKRFHLSQKEYDDRTRVIIMDYQGTKTGLMVDSVREVLNVSNNDISSPPASMSAGVSEQYISGIAKVDQGKRMVVLLAVEKILE